jgi:predicted PurR-regulated permease PerM
MKLSMDKPLILPFFAKASLFFIGSYALISMLYIAKGIIIPFIFSVIISIVLHPVVCFFVRKKINRVIAIIITLILTIIFIATFGLFIFSQAMRFGESWPKMVEKFTEIFNQTINLASDYFDISPEKINAWITKSEGEVINTSGTAIGQTLVNVGSGLVVLFIIPVYIFMLLFYHPLLIEFFRRVFGAGNRIMVSEIITQIKSVIQRYLTGLFLEVVIVSTLHSIGLLLLGIQYAILLGIIGALLNLIPYLGGIVSVALPMMIALATKTSPWYALYVLAIYYVIQLIDNNYIIPKIVASKVKINALVSILVVLAFGALWGLPGMFLSIPLTAIIKVIFDHIDPLKPWGFLLGDTMPTIEIFNLKLGKK